MHDTCNPVHENIKSRKEQHHLNRDEELPAVVPGAPANSPCRKEHSPQCTWALAPSGTEAPRGTGLWNRSWAPALPGLGGVRSAWAGTLPHLLISALSRPQGSEQHSCPGPHVPCLCHSRGFRMATSRDVSQGGRGSFCARPRALPAAAVSGAPSAALSSQSRAGYADGLSCC